MTKEEKLSFVENFSEKLNGLNYFYLADASTLTVAQSNELRGLCFENNVKFQVVKNILLKKAMEKTGKDYGELIDTLKGPTSIMYSDSLNAPAKIIKQFRKNHDRPVLKGAYIDSAFYIGDEHLDQLTKLKSKEELIAEIITLLQSPAKNVISALQSSGHKLSGVVKALSEREDTTSEAETAKEEPQKEELTKEEPKAEESSEEAKTEESTVEPKAETATESEEKKEEKQKEDEEAEKPEEKEDSTEKNEPEEKNS